MLTLFDSAYDWRRAERYPDDEFFRLVDEVVVRSFYGFVHPVGERLLAGRMTRDQLRFLAVQEYPYYAGTTWWNAYKLAHSDALSQQRLLHGPLLDELGTDLIASPGVPAHVDLFVEYCAGLGLSRGEVVGAPLVPGVVLAVTELMRIARERPQFEFIACSNLVVERMRPPFYRRLLDTFAVHYPWVPSAALRFYEVHAEADHGHASLGRRVVAGYLHAKRDQDAVFSAVLRSLCVRHVMYDGILAALDGNSPALAPWPNFPREPWPRPMETK